MKTRGSAMQLVLSLLLLGSIVINCLQGTRIVKLEAALDSFKEPAVLAQGAALPPLELRGDEGARVVIDYASTPHPTLIYVLSPSCIWCRRNAGSVRALAKAIKNDIRVVGVSLGSQGLTAFLSDDAMEFPVYVASDATIKAYRLGETPATILVSKDGVLIKQWRGAYTGETKSDIEAYFRLALPSRDERKSL